MLMFIVGLLNFFRFLFFFTFFLLIVMLDKSWIRVGKSMEGGVRSLRTRGNLQV